MKRCLLIVVSLLIVLPAASFAAPRGNVDLPDPSFKGTMSVEEAIQKRRSVRNYKPDSLTLKELSQLLWSTQGVTDRRTGARGRSTPHVRGG